MPPIFTGPVGVGVGIGVGVGVGVTSSAQAGKRDNANIKAKPTIIQRFNISSS
jgi:hypothetical protein